MSVLDTDSWASQHWIFKHSSKTQTAKTRCVNKWLLRNYHQLSLECGNVQYEELEPILNSLNFKTIYVKGEQKEKMIKQFIPNVEIVNMEEIGCPRLNQLICDNIESPPCCIHHMYLSKKQCTFYKVFMLKKWYIQNS